ncbi:hypothetical protein B484DRAFT_411624, partial [Ochromonadaceae sp. CCMP2298]
IKGEQDRVVVYCVASNFKPATEDSDRGDVALALENVSLFEDVVRLCCEAGVNRVILTSSMAAVRGPAQVPMNGQYFTAHEWNTVSTLRADSFASCYQYSKTRSEQRAVEIVHAANTATAAAAAAAAAAAIAAANSAAASTAASTSTSTSASTPTSALAPPHFTELVSLCPSMIFGPVRDVSQLGYSCDLVSAWLGGTRKVESRLMVDVRDAALAHLRAAMLPSVGLPSVGDDDEGVQGGYRHKHRRYIISQEKRITASETMSMLEGAGAGVGVGVGVGGMHCDELFDGGAVRIGDKEVEGGMGELGVVCRPAEETFRDMAQSLQRVR